MVTVAVVPVFTIEINLANDVFGTALAKVVQKDLDAPKACPNST